MKLRLAYILAKKLLTGLLVALLVIQFVPGLTRQIPEALAQAGTPDNPDAPDPDNPNDPLVFGPTDDFDFGPGADGQVTGGKQSSVNQARQKDSEQCQAEKGLGGVANSLGKQIGDRLLQTLNDTVTKIFQEKIPNLIREQIGERLPQLIEESIRGNFVSDFNREMSRLPYGANRNQMASQIATQIIQRLVTQAIQQGVPRIIRDTLQRNMPGWLADDFSARIPGILEESGFNSNVRDFTNQIGAQLPLAGVTVGDLPSVGFLPFPFGQPVLPADAVADAGESAELPEGVVPTISAEDGNAWSAALIDGSVEAAQDGLRNSNAIDSLTDLLVQRLLTQLVPLFVNSLNQQLSGAGGLFAGGGSSSGGNWDSTVGGLFGQDLSFSGGLTGDIFNPMVSEINKVIGPTIYQSITGVSTGIASGAIKPLADTVGNGGEYVDIMSEAGGDAAGKVSSAGQDISTKAFSSAGWNKFGQNMAVTAIKAGGDMLGSLVADNVPIVGGLLGRIVSNAVTWALVAYFGLPVLLLTGIPVADHGVSDAVSNSTKAAGKIGQATVKELSAINSSTKQTEKNTKHIESYEQQACTLEKQLKGVAYRAEDKYYKYDPAARKAAITMMQQLYSAWQRFFQTGRQTSEINLGASGQSYNAGEVTGYRGGSGIENGQPLQTINLEQDIKDARREAEAGTYATLKASGNLYADEVIRQLALANNQTAGRELASTMSEAEAERLNNSETIPNNEFWGLVEKKINPVNDRRGLLVLAGQMDESRQSSAEYLNTLRYAAGQGYSDLQFCAETEDDPVYGEHCTRWETVVPGSMIKAMTEFMQQVGLTQARDADSFQEDAANRVVLDWQDNFVNYLERQSAVQSAQVGRDPCPGTDPCPETGWGAVGAAALSGLETGLGNASNNLLGRTESYLNRAANNLFNFQYGGSGGSSDGGGFGYTSGSSFNFGQLGALLGQIGNLNLPGLTDEQRNAPAPTITFRSVTRDGATAGERETTLSWETQNATLCYTGNDWLDPESGAVGIEKYIQAKTVAEVKITYPNSATFSNTYQLVCFNARGEGTVGVVTVNNNQ